MKVFSGFGQNLKIMLPPARGLTFRGSSHSKIIHFRTLFSCPPQVVPKLCFSRFLIKKEVPEGTQHKSKPLENRVKEEPLKINLFTPFQARKMAPEIRKKMRQYLQVCVGGGPPKRPPKSKVVWKCFQVPKSSRFLYYYIIIYQIFCQIIIRFLSDAYQILIRFLLDYYQILIRFLLDYSQILIRLLLDSYQILIRFSLDSHQVLARLS